VDVTFNGEVRTPGTCPDSYTLTRTWTAEDDCGNIATCTQVITVQDTTPPVISALPGPSTVECPTEPGLVFAEPTATDVCDPNPKLTFADVITPGGCPQEYSVTRTWTATDACGNSSTASQTIEVLDDSAPVISGLPEPSAVECPADPEFETPTATDVCDPAPTLTFIDVITPGDCPQEYSVTRTWTATDACGNSSTASQTIKVVDTTPPVMTCPPDETVECNLDVPAPDISAVTASDSCGSVTVTYRGDLSSGTCPRVIKRTYRATDDCGNFDECVQTITVVDTIAPSITCPFDQVLTPCDLNVLILEFSEVPTSVGEDVFLSTGINAAASDNCGVVAYIYQDVMISAAGTCPIIIDRTWTVRDLCGNEASCVQNIKLQDPTAVTVSDIGIDVRDTDVVVWWETAAEMDTLGFRVFRKSGESWVQVTDHLMPAEGWLNGGLGAEYQVVDSSPATDGIYIYRLEELTVDGHIREYLVSKSAANFAQPLRIIDLKVTGEGLAIRWLSTEGLTYRVMRSWDLKTFEPVATSLSATAPENVYVDPLQEKTPVFYRIEVEQKN
jgi:hypothetical protein